MFYGQSDKERNNMPVQIIDNEGTKPCGAIYLNEEILEEFKDIIVDMLNLLKILLWLNILVF